MVNQLLSDLHRIQLWCKIYASEHRSPDLLFDLIMTKASEFVDEQRGAIEAAAAILYTHSKVTASELQSLGIELRSGGRSAAGSIPYVTGSLRDVHTTMEIVYGSSRP